MGPSQFYQKHQWNKSSEFGGKDSAIKDIQEHLLEGTVFWFDSRGLGS